MRSRTQVTVHIAIWMVVVFALYPMLALVSGSLKTNVKVMTDFLNPIPSPVHWSNYARAWHSLAQCLLNSVIVTAISIAGILAISSASAYVFARIHLPGKGFLFYLILILVMVPNILTLIPRFVLVRNLGLLNTRWVLILPYIAGGQIFAIFILRSFIESLPREIFESAQIDGASEAQLYAHIAMPLSKAVLGTVAIMNLIGIWNDFVWPMVTISDPRLRTVMVGISFFQTQYSADYGLIMAGYVMAAGPILVLFLLATRSFIEGLTSGALKA